MEKHVSADGVECWPKRHRVRLRGYLVRVHDSDVVLLRDFFQAHQECLQTLLALGKLAAPVELRAEQVDDGVDDDRANLLLRTDGAHLQSEFVELLRRVRACVHDILQHRLLVELPALFGNLADAREHRGSLRIDPDDLSSLPARLALCGREHGRRGNGVAELRFSLVRLAVYFGECLRFDAPAQHGVKRRGSRADAYNLSLSLPHDFRGDAELGRARLPSRHHLTRGVAHFQDFRLAESLDRLEFLHGCHEQRVCGVVSSVCEFLEVGRGDARRLECAEFRVRGCVLVVRRRHCGIVVIVAIRDEILGIIRLLHGLKVDS